MALNLLKNKDLMLQLRSFAFADIYENSLKHLYNNPDWITSPRGLQIKEILNFSFLLDLPLNCLFFNSRRSSPEKYIAAELLYYYRGKNDLIISNFAKLWLDIANSDSTINSAYGYMLFTRLNSHGITNWQWVLNLLKKDKDSRQAILYYGTPEYQYNDNKDYPCTCYQSFHIRGNKLHTSIRMRSSDAITGLPADLVWFVSVQIHLCHFLKETYPELEIGSLHFSADSYHIYAKHFELVEQMLNTQFSNKMLDFQSILINEKGEPVEEIEKYINLNKEYLSLELFNQKL